MTSLIRAFFFDPLERLTWHLCLCNVTNSKKKKKKNEGGCFRLMSWGMQYPVQILSAVCMPRCCTCLIPAETMPRLSCRWICPIYSLNITSDSTGFPRRRARIVFYFFDLCICFPSIPAHINAGDQCGWQTWWLHACVERARRITGVFARPCTTCGEGGKWHDWPNGDPPLRALGRGGALLALCSP